MRTLQGKLPASVSEAYPCVEYKLSSARILLGKDGQHLKTGESITVQVPAHIDGPVVLIINGVNDPNANLVKYVLPLEDVKMREVYGILGNVCNHCRKPILVSVDGRDTLPIVSAWMHEEITSARMCEVLEMWANGRDISDQLPTPKAIVVDGTHVKAIDVTPEQFDRLLENIGKARKGV